MFKAFHVFVIIIFVVIVKGVTRGKMYLQEKMIKGKFYIFSVGWFKGKFFMCIPFVSSFFVCTCLSNPMLECDRHMCSKSVSMMVSFEIKKNALEGPSCPLQWDSVVFWMNSIYFETKSGSPSVSSITILSFYEKIEQTFDSVVFPH